MEIKVTENRPKVEDLAAGTEFTYRGVTYTKIHPNALYNNGVKDVAIDSSYHLCFGFNSDFPNIVKGPPPKVFPTVTMVMSKEEFGVIRDSLGTVSEAKVPGSSRIYHKINGI